ncbi:MAG TPA: hypothetical protein VK540_32925 [Polyangiaceae bacterium]|nr:hypothetical protein [Polyangiaceae bacterium]
MTRTRTTQLLFAFGLVFASASCNSLFGIEEGLPWPDDAGSAGAVDSGGLKLSDASQESTTVPKDVSLGDATGDRQDASVGDATGGRDTSIGDSTGSQDAIGDSTWGQQDASIDRGDSGGEFDGAKVDAGPTNCSTAADCVGPHVRTGAPVSCMQGRCIVPDTSCVPGWGHCTSNDLEFCETDLTSPSHCGRCTQVCSATMPLCTAGACVSRCMGMTPIECGGSCVNTDTDVQNCGICGNVCVYPNAEAICAAAKCTMGACKPGYGDCTSVAGCETRLNTLAHCAECNKTCGAPGDTASCDTGACVISCVSKPEQCFNNLDDDCDGVSDCADPDCAAVAVCEPVSGFTFGTTVDPAINCPSSFSGGGPVLQGALDPGSGCTGCGCTPTTTDCTPVSLFTYATQADCLSRSNSNQSISIPQLTTGCTGVGFQLPWSGYTVDGSFNQKCSTTGMAKLSTPTWGSSTKFCAAASSSSTGCSAGNVCVPKPTGLACLLAAGPVSCPGGFTPQNLYTGYSDTRVCSCSCTASGGNCNDVVINITGTLAPTCDDFTGAYLGAGACGTTQYTQFGYKFSGSPTNPTACTTANDQQGSLTPTGQQTLCCR